MNIKKIDGDGKLMVLTGSEGETREMLREVISYADRFGFQIDTLRLHMGDVYDDRDCEVEYK